MRIKFEFISSFAAILMAGALMLVSPGAQAQDDGSEAHGAILSEDAFPSASQCTACHEQIYDEWSSSNHAYASISPMFHKFEQAINALTQGTIGAFCVRCATRAPEPLWARTATRPCGSVVKFPARA